MAPLALILAPLVGVAVAAVAVYFWPAIMGWTREHLLPWVDRNIPELADAVRLAFQNLDGIAVDLRRMVRSAWRRLRKVLLHETARFVELADTGWAVQITSYLRTLEEGEKPVVRVVTEQKLAWDELPEEIRAQALSDGLHDSAFDVTKTRDQLLSEAH
ncbi:hypothetical protein BZB76_2824 [Actinomadura pelletieri DSM 43383]|uniref:Uncharacterized protein n=1 Tax=Actinomadura pelletieri DSM 43383 TaxID=1120940 RepID=A0A495QMW3_9ACTN|nr:hypothetical protein [Actinomadura pelletieri]RKS74313.1 hypothetical protein BZB76_2824 [Actinomadura pelletieri DSM 43383]